MIETVLSVGIDIGTTTTQLVFSALDIENTAGVGSVPRVSVVGKRIVYRSPIHFTPLVSPSVIDADAVRRIVEGEYAASGFARDRVSAGAIIITGETARKENAESLLQSLSDLAGNFVVATAGSDLEGILAGKGSGAASFSKREHLTVANFDVGGGTTNVALFREGEVVDTSCLDIGGRLVRVDPATRRVLSLAPKLRPVAASLGLGLEVGLPAPPGALEALCERMAAFFDELMGLREKSPLFASMLTAHDFRHPVPIQGVAFSGGVADVMEGVPPGGPLAYGDIGVLLGKAVGRTALFRTYRAVPTEETIRATVVGAGSHAVDISGSTIGFSDEAIFPLKNLPILKLTPDEERQGLAKALGRKIRWYADRDLRQAVAVSFRGKENPSFDDVQRCAEGLLAGLGEYVAHHGHIIVVVEHDMAKALGYALRSRLRDGVGVVSIDGIAVENGDYIDIGKPLARGRVVPVVIKTLVFGA